MKSGYSGSNKSSKHCHFGQTEKPEGRELVSDLEIAHASRSSDSRFAWPEWQRFDVFYLLFFSGRRRRVRAARRGEEQRLHQRNRH